MFRTVITSVLIFLFIHTYAFSANVYGNNITKNVKAGGEAVEGMVLVKGGCFQMGCGGWTSNCDEDEKPVHEVCVDNFYMDVYEVMQEAYRKELGENPSHFKGDDNPVENVTWYDAKKYCKKVDKRLPTEAEWEYAARSGGKREKYAGTSSDSRLGEYAWYVKNSGGITHPVGQKKPNGLGLYDMSGNVWEWVADWYHEKYYQYSSKHNPKGPGADRTHLQYRVLRGGSWNFSPRNVRTALRIRYNPDLRFNYFGFRCTRTY